jgi:hypothetical protein
LNSSCNVRADAVVAMSEANSTTRRRLPRIIVPTETRWHNVVFAVPGCVRCQLVAVVARITQKLSGRGRRWQDSLLV